MDAERNIMNSDNWDEYEAKGKLEPIVGESLGTDGVRRPIKGNSDNLEAILLKLSPGVTTYKTDVLGRKFVTQHPNYTKVLEAKAALLALLEAEAETYEIRRLAGTSSTLKAIPLETIRRLFDVPPH